MDFTQLRYFKTVAKTGNVSKASKLLYVTQPNISKSIARLEEEIGVLLFDHRKGKITLNEYGRVFLSSVEVAFSELTTGVQTIQRLYESNQGILSLACTIVDLLPDLLKHFSIQYPEIGIRQFSYSIDTILENLLDRSLNIAITSEKINDARIVFELIGETDYIILVNEKHPLAAKNEAEIPELAAEKFICDSTRLNKAKLKKICRNYDFVPDVAFEVDNPELIYQLLKGNAGIAFVPIPQYAKITNEYRAKNIRAVRLVNDIPPAIIGIAYHKDYVLSKAAEQFISFIKDWQKTERINVKKLGF